MSKSPRRLDRRAWMLRCATAASCGWFALASSVVLAQGPAGPRPPAGQYPPNAQTQPGQYQPAPYQQSQYQPNGPQPQGPQGNQQQPTYPTGQSVQQGPMPVLPPPQPIATIRLTPEENAALDLVLRRWEHDSSKIKSLSCDFEVWKTNGVFKDKNGNPQVTHHIGELRYQAPDKGSYQIVYEVANGARNKIETGDHWLCDGKSIFEFRHMEKKLIERKLPPDAQGEALIQESPLPFLFGAKADQLRKRYLMRETTTPEDRAKGQVWLEAYPRFQHDAANFVKAEVILTMQTSDQLLLPYGLRLQMTNDRSDVSHVFKGYSLNAFFGGIRSPSTPFRYTREVVEAPSRSGETPATPASDKPKPRIWNPFQRGSDKS